MSWEGILGICNKTWTKKMPVHTTIARLPTTSQVESLCKLEKDIQPSAAIVGVSIQSTSQGTHVKGPSC